MTLRSKSAPLLAVVTNYAFSAEADFLKAELEKFVDTLLIDNSSPVAPQTADITITNDYYTGLWNAAVNAAKARQKKWLLFVAADVQIDNVELLVARLEQVVSDASIGLYTPAVRSGSRLAYPACYQRPNGRLRECYVCEGFFFFVRIEIAEELYPVDRKLNRYGWGIDVLTAYFTYLRGYRAVVDDAVTIFHPAAVHDIPVDEAESELQRYLDPCVWNFLRWTKLQIARQSSRSIFPCWLAALWSRRRWRRKELARLAATI